MDDCRDIGLTSFCLSSQWHPEGGSDVSRPSKEDPQQRPDDAGTDEPDPVSGGLTLPHGAEGGEKRIGCRALGVKDGVDVFLFLPLFSAWQCVWSSHRTNIHPPYPPLLSPLLSPHPKSLQSLGSAVERKTNVRVTKRQRPHSQPTFGDRNTEVRSDQQNIFQSSTSFHLMLNFFFRFVCSDNFVKNFLKKKKNWEKARSLSKFIDDIMLYTRWTE